MTAEYDVDAIVEAAQPEPESIPVGGIAVEWDEAPPLTDGNAPDDAWPNGAHDARGSPVPFPRQGIRERRGLVIAGARDTGPEQDLDAFLSEPEPDHDWVIPDVVERGDRAILTGGEGDGKSTLLRQIAVQAASGIHPFTLEAMPPVRTLLIDLENGRRHVRRKLRPLRRSAGECYQSPRLIVRVQPGGLDLLQDADAEWFAERVDRNRPELVVAGPLYKLSGGDPRLEEVARHVSGIIDRLRQKHEFALLLEAHQPYGTSGSGRPGRPYGASLWSRWPEFGLQLSAKGQLRHWRGDRDERAWPAVLKRGGEWPWTVEHDRRAVSFARMLDELRHVGRKLSVRDLEERLGISKSQVHRAIEVNRAEWEAALAEVGG